MTAGYAIDDAHLISANTLAGQPLFDRAGDKLGVLKELFVNRNTGQEDFVLAATGGFLGVGEKFPPLLSASSRSSDNSSRSASSAMVRQCSAVGIISLPFTAQRMEDEYVSTRGDRHRT